MSDSDQFLFGKDLKIFYNSEEEISELELNSGDIKTSDYTANVLAAINRRLMSSSREIIFHENYGGFLSVFVSNLNSPTTRAILYLIIKSELEKEPRVKEVLNINLNVTLDRQIQINYQVLLIDEQIASNSVFINSNAG